MLDSNRQVLGVAGRGKVVNRRILLISDYMPPQTHGIAIRLLPPMEQEPSTPTPKDLVSCF